MNQSKESSVLFSLRELMSLEAARLDEERAEAERKAEEALASALAGEQRAREEAEAARVREETRAQGQARAEREEEARLAAIREAALERVRQETAVALQVEARRVEQTHEQALAAMAHDRVRLRLSYTVVGLFASLTVVIGLAVAATVHFRSESATRDAVAAAQREAAVEQRSKLRAMERTLEEQREALERLPKTPADPIVPPVASVAPPHPVPSRPKPHPAKDPGTACAHEGDPLCTQLP